MEAQLAAYRARKAKEHNSTTSSLFSSLFRRASVKQSENNAKGQDKNSSDTSASNVFQSTLAPVPQSAPTPPDAAASPFSPLTLLLHPTFLKVILWLILWGLFIELEFGAVYFVISSLYIIYANTRTGPKADGSLSAYSVFNPNYERLEGTFTSEQFEKELRYGAAAVH